MSLESVKNTLKTVLGDKIPNLDKKIEEQLNIFRESEAVVFCEDCLTVFCAGNAQTVAETKTFDDWKMLAFRHVWDTQHKVVIHFPYFALSMFSLSNYSNLFDPQDKTKVLYYKTVEQLRTSLLMKGDPRANRSNDENWDANSVCFCSTCGKSHHNPKDACYCCYGTKQWMPFSEVDTIEIRKEQ